MLGAAFDDVEDPVEGAFFALELHIRAHILSVDLRCLGYDAQTLGIVLVDVLLGARVDEIQLKVRRRRGIVSGVAVGEKPGIDVVCAEVFDVAEGSGE